MNKFYGEHRIVLAAVLAVVVLAACVAVAFNTFFRYRKRKLNGWARVGAYLWVAGYWTLSAIEFYALVWSFNGSGPAPFLWYAATGIPHFMRIAGIAMLRSVQSQASPPEIMT